MRCRIYNFAAKKPGILVPVVLSACIITVCSGEDKSEGKFVAMDGGNSLIAYSTDGKTWITKEIDITANWKSVCYGAGKFVAVSGTHVGSDIGAYSTDGINWNPSEDELSVHCTPKTDTGYNNKLTRLYLHKSFLSSIEYDDLNLFS